MAVLPYKQEPLRVKVSPGPWDVPSGASEQTGVGVCIFCGGR